MIKITSQGKFEKTRRFFKKMSNFEVKSILDKYGKKGVNALASATPKDSGKTAGSWSYEIIVEDGTYTIQWNNSNVNKGVNIAIILQYGHGTGTGGYVAGKDYINPAVRPIFEQMADTIWKEVKSS